MCTYVSAYRFLPAAFFLEKATTLLVLVCVACVRAYKEIDTWMNWKVGRNIKPSSSHRPPARSQVFVS